MLCIALHWTDNNEVTDLIHEVSVSIYWDMLSQSCS